MLKFYFREKGSRLGPKGFPQPDATGLMIRSNIEQSHATKDCPTWTAQVISSCSSQHPGLSSWFEAFWLKCKLQSQSYHDSDLGSSRSTENPSFELRTKTCLKMNSIFWVFCVFLEYWSDGRSSLQIHEVPTEHSIMLTSSFQTAKPHIPNQSKCLLPQPGGNFQRALKPFSITP